tara:strand:+ start:9061 stop:9393 length:333 start_codon:yes stop_codon:yes gene_type:complete
MKRYLYVFVRNDLRPSQKIVQSIHATYEVGKTIEDDEDHPSVVLLKAKNEEQLINYREKVKDLGFRIKSFNEPYYDDSLTSFCVEPISEEERKYFKSFKLLNDYDLKKVR